jgi:ThiF family
MKPNCTVRFSRLHYDKLYAHLFPGDRDEHGAVVLAGQSVQDGKLSLHVRDVVIAKEGVDYVAGKIGYRALTPQFIHKHIVRARDERLVYIAVHNHESDEFVNFSSIDLHSHETGYPALLQIARGMPVGAMVLGRRSMEVDIWLNPHQRCNLERAVIVGNTLSTLYAAPPNGHLDSVATYDRQIRMFGNAGQTRLAAAKVAIVGLGGVGSLVAEFLGRLGVGRFLLIDGDVVEHSNLSRICGADVADADNGTPKVDVAARVIRQANPRADVSTIRDDVAKQSVAKELTACDYIFLAADSMRARLLVNALVQQYLIPAVQMGAKVRTDEKGKIIDVMSANRPLRPGPGCLWCNQLIDPYLLAQEAKTDQERRDQAYGVQEPNPSVISLNAVAASSAVNDFMMDFLGIRPNTDTIAYQHTHHLVRRVTSVAPRQGDDCPECSYSGARYGLGDGASLPTITG